MRRVFLFFFYFLQSPTNAQLIDELLYCSYMFRHYFVILRELVVITLLSYTSVSVQSLVIHFKISHVLCCWILIFTIFKICSIYNKMAKIILLLQLLWSPVWWPYIQSVINMEYMLMLSLYWHRDTGSVRRQHQHTDCVYDQHIGLHENCNN